MAEVYIAKKDDPLHKYLYIEDADGKEIPSWIFLEKLNTAEPCIDVFREAKKRGYKVFNIMADSGYWKIAIAAKEIKAEDIVEDYGDYLLAHKVIVEEEKL